jgi:hypothetical protein
VFRRRSGGGLCRTYAPLLFAEVFEINGQLMKLLVLVVHKYTKTDTNGKGYERK